MEKAILDVSTGEMTLVPLSAEEIAERKQIAQEQAAKLKEREQAEAEAQAKRLTALAKLEALGLNEADLKALGL